MSDRPSIDEHDAHSYLEASMMPHAVLSGDETDGLRVDGAPCYDFDAFNTAPDLCREHAYDLARTVGFEGPMTLPVSYQDWLPCEPEEVMTLRIDGLLVLVAPYDYGRAYFEPGEPRTAPCVTCGAETLIDTLVAALGTEQEERTE